MQESGIKKKIYIYLKLSVSWERDVEFHSSPFAAPSELAAA
jgi:hypothetical protein